MRVDIDEILLEKEMALTELFFQLHLFMFFKFG
jgi:hypothetical protein